MFALSLASPGPSSTPPGLSSTSTAFGGGGGGASADPTEGEMTPSAQVKFFAFVERPRRHKKYRRPIARTDVLAVVVAAAVFLWFYLLCMCVGVCFDYCLLLVTVSAQVGGGKICLSLSHLPPQKKRSAFCEVLLSFLLLLLPNPSLRHPPSLFLFLTRALCFPRPLAPSLYRTPSRLTPIQLHTGSRKRPTSLEQSRSALQTPLWTRMEAWPAPAPAPAPGRRRGSRPPLLFFLRRPRLCMPERRRRQHHQQLLVRQQQSWW